ncbi:hypothetical protein AMTRI_Chr02g214780 [Amborella trichopoda]
MSREGIIVFQLIWNVMEQLRGPVPVPDAAHHQWLKPRCALLHKAPKVVSYRVELSALCLKTWCPTLPLTRIIPLDGHIAPHSVHTPIGARQGHIHWSLVAKPLCLFTVILKLNYSLAFEDFWNPSCRVLHVCYWRALYVLVSGLPLPCTMSY